MAMTAQEKEWQADSDAWALLQAQQVKDDPNRMSAAQSKLDKLAEDKADEASAARRAKTGRAKAKLSNDTGSTDTGAPPVSIRGEAAVPAHSIGGKGIMGE